MVKNERYLLRRKSGASSEEKSNIAREMALLRILAGKLSCRTPHLAMWEPTIPMFTYPSIPGVTLNSGHYVDLTRKQQMRLAEDIATFAAALHKEIPVEFAQALGFTATTWPLNPEILQQTLSGKLVGATQPFFEHFLEIYTQVLATPYAPTFLHHDLHTGNILVHQRSGRLQGIIDFEDAAIGDPYQEFRLLYEIDANLMEEAAYFYTQQTRKKFDIQRIHAYYLATEYSRMVEIMQGKNTKYDLHEIAVNIMLYEEKYGSIPKRQRAPLAW